METSLTGYKELYKEIFMITEEISDIQFPNNLKETIDYVLKNQLTEREETIIILRRGLKGYSSMTYREIGELLKLSTSNICSKYHKTIRKMRHPSRSRAIQTGVLPQKELEKPRSYEEKCALKKRQKKDIEKEELERSIDSLSKILKVCKKVVSDGSLEFEEICEKYGINYKKARLCVKNANLAVNSVDQTEEKKN